jgi:septal ring factor EnvC (AmiA/AmiB activator)
MSLSWQKAVNKTMVTSHYMGTLVISVSLLISSSIVHADTNVLNQGRSVIGNDAQQSVKSQQKVDALDDAYQGLVQDYRTTNGEIDQLKLYNKQMSAIVESQQSEITKIDQQIKDIEYTEQGILPLMSRMLDSLEQFNQLDLPFLKKERATRLAKLRELMTRGDITVSEKYRRVLEAFQIEVEYGRTLESYREKADDNIVYDYLRIGRTALYRLTLTADAAWAWDKKTSEWIALDSSLLRDVRKAQNVARQTAAPELLILPIGTPKLSKGSL